MDADGLAMLAPPKRAVNEITTSNTATPARLSTPPPPSDRGRLEPRAAADNNNVTSARRSGRVGGSSGVDPEILSKALSREITTDRRDSTPGASPSRKRQRINGDR